MTHTDTQERILDAAQRLFAEKGFAETSLRAITTEAQVNLAAVNYHFGTKEALIQAVFRRLVEPVNEERLELLDRCLETEPPVLEEIVWAFVSPPLCMALDASRGGEIVVRLYGRLHAEPLEMFGPMLQSLFGEVQARFEAALATALPHLTPRDLGIRFHFMLGTMSHTMIHRRLFCDPGHAVNDPQDTDLLLRTMVGFIAAGMRAETPPSRMSPDENPMPTLKDSP